MADTGLTAPDDYDYADDLDDECGNCGGEGFTYHCIDGCCVDAEEGCELCASRCDWCNPPRAITASHTEKE